MVLGKTAAFGVLMYLAAFNKGRYGHRRCGGRGGCCAGVSADRRAEWSVLAVVLVATALMTELNAPAHLEGAFGTGHGGH